MKCYRVIEMRFPLPWNLQEFGHNETNAYFSCDNYYAMIMFVMYVKECAIKFHNQPYV